MSTADVRTDFDQLITWATGSLQGDEVLLASLRGETSDFVRFNHAAVRQAGSVQQQMLSVDLVEGARHAEGFSVPDGDREIDQARVAALLLNLRAQRAVLPEDPFLLYATDGITLSGRSTGPCPQLLMRLRRSQVAQPGGFRWHLAARATHRAFGSSLGQRNWFEASTFNLDWSLHTRRQGDQERLCRYELGGRRLPGQARLVDSRTRCTGSRTEELLPPGAYRSFLTPWRSRRSRGCCRGVGSVCGLTRPDRPRSCEWSPTGQRLRRA